MTRPSSRKPAAGDDRVLGLDVDAGEGLVEQDDPAVLRQCAGQEDALLLPARQFADLALAEIAHADAGKRGFDSVVIGRPAMRSMFMWP
jgi:hypothetical protein